MTEQSSPVPPKAHAPSPLDIPARTAAAPKPAPPRPAQPGPVQPGSAQPGGPVSGGVQTVAAQPAGSHPGSQPAGRPQSGTVRVTGAQALVLALERIGVDVVFGIPGGAVLPAYDPLIDSEQIRHILVRHEQGAGHAATGYAQATGR